MNTPLPGSAIDERGAGSRQPFFPADVAPFLGVSILDVNTSGIHSHPRPLSGKAINDIPSTTDREGVGPNGRELLITVNDQLIRYGSTSSMDENIEGDIEPTPADLALAREFLKAHRSAVRHFQRKIQSGRFNGTN